MKFVEKNLNPFHKKIGDCMIRALVAGTRFGYKTLCKATNAKYEEFVGNDYGVPFKNFTTFVNKYKFLEEIPLDLSSEKDIDLSQREIRNMLDYGDYSLRFYLENLKYKGEVIFVTKIKPTDTLDPEMLTNSDTTRYHAVYADLIKGVYWDLEDPGNTIVVSVYKIVSRCKKESRYYFEKEAKELWDEKVRDFRNNLKKTRDNPKEVHESVMKIWSEKTKKLFD